MRLLERAVQKFGISWPDTEPPTPAMLAGAYFTETVTTPNMAGKHTGAQAILRRQQPLPLYVHCGAHCVNLIIQAGCSASPLIQDCLSWVHQLGTLFGRSGKFKSMFETIATSENAPLCPTRWIVRHSALIAVRGQYEQVLGSLEEMAKSTSKTASTASGLFEHFSKGKTALGTCLCCYWRARIPQHFTAEENSDCLWYAGCSVWSSEEEK